MNVKSGNIIRYTDRGPVTYRITATGSRTGQNYDQVMIAPGTPTGLAFLDGLWALAVNPSYLDQNIEPTHTCQKYSVKFDAKSTEYNIGGQNVLGPGIQNSLAIIANVSDLLNLPISLNDLKATNNITLFNQALNLANRMVNLRTLKPVIIGDGGVAFDTELVGMLGDVNDLLIQFMKTQGFDAGAQRGDMIKNFGEIATKSANKAFKAIGTVAKNLVLPLKYLNAATNIMRFLDIAHAMAVTPTGTVDVPCAISLPNGGVTLSTTKLDQPISGTMAIKNNLSTAVHGQIDDSKVDDFMKAGTGVFDIPANGTMDLPVIGKCNGKVGIHTGTILLKGPDPEAIPASVTLNCVSSLETSSTFDLISTKGELHIKVWDTACEDGDIIALSLGNIFNRTVELTNAGQEFDLTLPTGTYPFTITAVNGSGNKGPCDYSDSNTYGIHLWTDTDPGTNAEFTTPAQAGYVHTINLKVGP